MKIILILSVISISISACGDDESLVAPEPANPQNSPPVINTIFVPEQVHAGARITLGALTEDLDGDALTYNWQAAGGLLSSKSKAQSDLDRHPPKWASQPSHYLSKTLQTKLSLNQPRSGLFIP